MDIFSCLIDQEVVEGRFAPFYLGNLIVSHLLFMDNVLVFEKANSSTLDALQGCFSSLYKACDLTINGKKSLIYFTRSTPDTLTLYNMVNLQIGFLIKYLEISLLDSNLKVINFIPLLDKIYSWLAK